MTNIGLVTTDEDFLQGADPEILLIQDALRQTGLNATSVIWHESHDWSAFDLLVIRSPWDYPERFDEFTSWMASTQKQTRILNAPQLIRWNSDKQYLTELHQQGIHTGITKYCTTIEECKWEISQYIESEASYVIKPNISVGSRDTGLFAATSVEALQLCRSILNVGKTVLIQHAIDRVQEGGERGLLFFNGRFSHAIRKGPILRPGGGYFGGTYTENITPAQATDSEINLGLTTMEAIAHIAQAKGWDDDAHHPLYARIDVVTPESGNPILLEAELFEPSVFLRYGDGALKRFVEAITARLS